MDLLLVQFLPLQLREKVNLFLQSQEWATPSCPTLESSPQPITPLSSEALVDHLLLQLLDLVLPINMEIPWKIGAATVQLSLCFFFFLTSGYFHNYRWTFLTDFWLSNWNFVVWRSPKQSSPNSQDRTGPSKPQSFSESIKSKFNAVSMRY